MKPIELKIIESILEFGVFTIKSFELFDVYGRDGGIHTPAKFREFIKSRGLSFLFREDNKIVVY